MNQDDLFAQSEGDNWFRRNRHALQDRERFDWPFFVLSRLGNAEAIRSVLELGSADGWRLARLREHWGAERRYVGVDASREAVEDGKRRHAGIELHQGLISDVPLRDGFDLVIVHFVFHWVDRTTLSRSIAETDRLVRDGGFLLVGDFYPDHPQRRAYHHRSDVRAFTYKQDYAAAFHALGIYEEICRVAYDHDRLDGSLGPCDSGSRASCVLLCKSLQGRYRDVP